MKYAIVVAKSSNAVIGIDNGLPWHLPEDLKQFKAVTLGHPMIMGRRTYDSIGRPLPGRTTIVVTRNREWVADNVLVAQSIVEAKQLAEREAKIMGVDTVMVVGGANIYEQVLPRADLLYVTEVHIQVDGDAYFPDVDLSVWEQQSRVDAESQHEPFVGFSFITYHKKSSLVE